MKQIEGNSGNKLIHWAIILTAAFPVEQSDEAIKKKEKPTSQSNNIFTCQKKINLE